MTTRKKISSSDVAEVLTRSRRRCCICFGLRRDIEVKAGQIAHLDGDRSNNTFDNLAFLCLEHHDHFDSRTSQSKNFTLSEVKKYREELYDKVLLFINKQVVHSPKVDESAFGINKVSLTLTREQELKEAVFEVLSDAVAPLHSLNTIAQKLGLSRPTLEHLLHELANEGIVRVDRPRGSTKKVYSLISSLENQLISTFVSMLGDRVVEDCRYLRRGSDELDAVIKTNTGLIYTVETTYAKNQLSRDLALDHIKRLNYSKKALGFHKSINVLLIGITASTLNDVQNLKDLEEPGLLIKYMELEKH